MIGSCNNIKFSVPDEPVEGVTLDLNEANKVSTWIHIRSRSRLSRQPSPLASDATIAKNLSSPKNF